MPGEGPHGPRYSMGARREAREGQSPAQRPKPVLTAIGKNARFRCMRLPRSCWAGCQDQGLSRPLNELQVVPAYERERERQTLSADDVSWGSGDEATAQVWLLR